MRAPTVLFNPTKSSRFKFSTMTEEIRGNQQVNFIPKIRGATYILFQMLCAVRRKVQGRVKA